MNEQHTPNHIPASERLVYVILSLFLLVYGGCGVWSDHLDIPSKGGRVTLTLHGVPAWIMYGACICGCLVMLSVVIDHYDKRNNETKYKQFADVFRMLGLGLVALSLVVAMFR